MWKSPLENQQKNICSCHQDRIKSTEQEAAAAQIKDRKTKLKPWRPWTGSDDPSAQRSWSTSSDPS